jgi:putative FmdB family regulatory protein
MPIYEYECRQCGHRFEYLVLSTSPSAACPACQKTDLTQLVSLCAVSSDGTQQANLSAQHKKMAGIRQQKQHAEHAGLHEHFQDPTA